MIQPFGCSWTWNVRKHIRKTFWHYPLGLLMDFERADYDDESLVNENKGCSDRQALSNLRCAEAGLHVRSSSFVELYDALKRGFAIEYCRLSADWISQAGAVRGHKKWSPLFFLSKFVVILVIFMWWIFWKHIIVQVNPGSFNAPSWVQHYVMRWLMHNGECFRTLKTLDLWIVEAR